MNWSAINDETVVSLASNFGIGAAFVLTLGIVITEQFKGWSQLHASTKRFAIGFLLLSVGVLWRIPYWGVALWFAYPDNPAQRYHPWFIEHRHLSYVPTMPLIFSGLYLTLTAIHPERTRAITWALIAAFAFGAVAAVTWQASQLGLWFYRGEVIQWFESLVGYQR